MFKYGPRKKLKSKYDNDDKKKEKINSHNNYMKMYNLELETINPKTILALQNRIGNKATEELLKELSMTDLVSNNNVANLVVNKNKPYNNDTNSKHELVENFRGVSDTNTNNAGEILKRHMTYKETRQIGRVKLNAEKMSYVLDKLSELSTILRTKSFDEQEKALKIKNDDKMLNIKEKGTVTDVETILRMIEKLPVYNHDDETIEQYMKVFNLLTNTGVNIYEFLSENNHIDIQKKLLYTALGARTAGEE